MKHLLIITILFPVLLFGQNKTDGKGQKQGAWEVKFEDSDIVRYRGQFKDNKPYGKFEYYYPNGKLSAVSKFDLGGIVVRTTMFDIEGSPMGYGKYINQQKDSTWTYFQNNQVISKEDYKNGERHGKKTVFYDDGQVYEEYHFANNLEEGQWKMYYPNGNIKITCNYVNGNRNGQITYYYNDGQQETVGFYKNAVKNGFWRYYDIRGRVSKEVFYKNDKIILEGQDIKEELDQLKAEGKI